MSQNSRMRYLKTYIEKDLNDKMVLLGGPRQAGKTTLAQQILKQRPGLYLNWDADEDRDIILNKKWEQSEQLLIFDELHKYKRWKNWIKGTFDKERTHHQFLITGSARLDIYKQGGDSLFGRYNYWRLHPFTLCELPSGISKEEGFRRLLELGGFPEPFLKNNSIEAKRWRRSRYDLVIKQDLRDLESVQDISKLELFFQMLRERVGGMVVLSNLANDLEIAPKTAKKWLLLLERMYLLFIVKPYSSKMNRALVKPPKVYFYDNADVKGDIGARFENLVACHLLKQIHFLEDHYGDSYELHYLRDKEKREVDFLILKEGKVEQLIETKWNDSAIPTSLLYYQRKLSPKRASLVVGTPLKSYDKEGISVRYAIPFLSEFKYV